MSQTRGGGGKACRPPLYAYDAGELVSMLHPGYIEYVTDVMGEDVTE